LALRGQELKDVFSFHVSVVGMLLMSYGFSGPVLRGFIVECS